jgi:hypothetical protein
MTLMGAIFPITYIYAVQSGMVSEAYFHYDYVSNKSFFTGNMYTVISIGIMIFTAIRLKPAALSNNQIRAHNLIYSRYANIIFVLGVLSLIISIVLSALYGMSISNLTAGRPMPAVYFGYLSTALYFATYLYIIYQILLFNKLSKKGWLMMILLLFSLSMSWSRSGLMLSVFLFLFAFSYSFKKNPIKWNYLISITLIGIVFVLFGQYMRSGDSFAIISEILLRLYANNSVLYLAISDHDKIYNILMQDQPWTLFDQLFSFIVERTRYPSSFRLNEYFGGSLNITDRGHVVGYAYGWLGLTYGLFKWYGLIAIYFVFSTIFKIIRKSLIRPSLMKMAFLVVSARILLEFFGNLGLDSFLEKVFKMSLSAVVLVLIIKVIYIVFDKCNIIRRRNFYKNTENNKSR